MKVLITGVCGTGKSTISKALKDRGIISVDFSDIQGMCYWKNLKTKEKVPYSPIESLDWFDNKNYFCDLNKLKKILAQHENIVIRSYCYMVKKQYINITI